MIKVVFVTQGDQTLASSRFRVYDLLKFCPDDIQFQTLSLPASGLFSRVYFLLQLLLLAVVHDIIFLQKILLPQTVLSWLTRMNVKLVYDYDDALFARPPSNIFEDEASAKKKAMLQFTLSRVDHVVCGNHYLAEYTGEYCSAVSVIPTAVDVNEYKPSARAAESQPVVIGWIGKSENLEYLKSLSPVLTRLGQRFQGKLCLHVVCDKPLGDVNGITVRDIPWEMGTESLRISSFDIGIMPLSDSEWSRGKCAFKLIQYMASGVASVCSPVGMNSEVVVHRQNGLLAATGDEWYESLESLVIDRDLRYRLGDAGRHTVIEKFDSSSAAIKLYAVLRSVAGGE